MAKKKQEWTAKLDNLLFYKYRDDVGKDDCNLKIISDSSVWFDNPSNFNDPFDCHPIPSRRSSERIHRVVQSAINNTDNPHLSDADREQVRLQYKADPDKSVDLIDQLSSTEWYVEHFMRDYLVFSLSKNPLIRLMWSHYSNNHKGFVIEFDLMELFKKEQAAGVPENPEDSFFPMPVKYKKDRPEIHEEGLENSSDPLFIKDDIWTYEKEYRMLRTGKRRLVDYEPKYLSSVILGARVCPDLKARVQDTVYEFNSKHRSNVKIYQTELCKKSFDLQIPGHPHYKNR